jgi:hypothetical protein
MWLSGRVARCGFAARLASSNASFPSLLAGSAAQRQATAARPDARTHAARTGSQCRVVTCSYMISYRDSIPEGVTCFGSTSGNWDRGEYALDKRVSSLGVSMKARASRFSEPAPRLEALGTNTLSAWLVA